MTLKDFLNYVQYLPDEAQLKIRVGAEKKDIEGIKYSVNVKDGNVTHEVVIK